MRLITRAAAGQWIAATNQAERVTAKALTISTRQLGKAAVTRGRQRISAAGFSTSTAATLVALNKPPTGYVLNPAVYIHSTINYFDVFQKGKTITGGNGRSASPYLWLPTPNVPPNPGSGLKFGGIVHRDHMTPSQYVRKVGPLFTIVRANGMPLLATRIKGGGTRRPSARRLRRTGQLREAGFQLKDQDRLVIMFVAVKQITIPKKFDVDAAVDEVFEEFQDAYDTNVKPEENIP